ncbi:Holliday junction branch migration protein RuvA [Lacticaseibacillus pabuli]|uniref:Holliday junction branch migration complex subunit RuvA n=1 Tax=Lacticaseibacillus pabuli TaxID=3025672 RepID=A0ABY7WT80_9LACO|nr:Holliday junction branch migration protein RuvA [Lacticaseibacillus sp. KACC 23028]WDF83373.1 Holliday junction branch migration protein RuvA [Lacticaseibacillus sp. KACC 23028]
MYEFFKGVVAAVTPQYVVIDVNGVGYRLLVANPYVYREGSDVQIYAQLVIRDTDQSLYGFQDQEQKQLFNMLLSVTGIGPKSALAILANVDTQGLAQAVAANDVKFLTHFPGIGKKTAQQIILDLQGKLDLQELTLAEASSAAATPAASNNQQLDDAVAALTALGFTEREVAKITPKLAQEDVSKTEDYLRVGLKLLTKN